MTIADDLRAAAEAVVDLQRLRHGTHIGCAKCEEKWRFVTRLCQHADTIERVEKEMREHADDWRHKWKQAIEWANDLRGDKS